jgi:hypothetical protein
VCGLPLADIDEVLLSSDQNFVYGHHFCKRKLAIEVF